MRKPGKASTKPTRKPRKAPTKKPRKAPVKPTRKLAKLRRPPKKVREATRRARISAALLEFHKTGKTRKAREKAQAKAVKLPGLPRGFERVDSRPRIGFMLRQAGEEIGARYGFDHDLRQAINADKSVAYELRFALPDKIDPQILLTDVANALRPISGTWLTFGFRFRPGTMSPEMAAKYDRYKGTMQLQAYSQRSSPGHLATLEATAEEIYRNVKRRRKGWKAETLFVRVMWSPDGNRPERRTNLKGK
jgi:hypothetical protein